MSDEITTDQELEVRRQSLQTLEVAGFTVAGSLPIWSEWSGEPFRLRPSIDIARRIMCLDAFVMYVDSDANSEDDIRRHVADAQLSEHFNSTETAAFAKSRDEARSEHYQTKGWNQENLWSLAWVLQFHLQPGIRDGFIDGEVYVPLQTEFLPSFGVSPEDLLKSRVARTPIEVLGLHDLFYCAHNAVRSAQNGGATIPDGFDPITDGGVVHEKRHSLTWCISPGVAWDETDLST